MKLKLSIMCQIVKVRQFMAFWFRLGIVLPSQQIVLFLLSTATFLFLNFWIVISAEKPEKAFPYHHRWGFYFSTIKPIKNNDSFEDRNGKTVSKTCCLLFARLDWSYKRKPSFKNFDLRSTMECLALLFCCSKQGAPLSCCSWKIETTRWQTFNWIFLLPWTKHE